MRIAVTAEGPSLDVAIDQRFGRCPFFLIVNTGDLTFEAIPNGSASQRGGAGIQAAQMIVGKGVTHVFTGACGPNAYQVLAAAGVQVIVGCTGTVQDVIRQCREGRFVAAAEPNVRDHYGVGQPLSGQAGTPMGIPGGFTTGMGMGRGMGRGKGRGMGVVRGIGTDPNVSVGQAPGAPVQPKNAQQELELLKKQMQDIKNRIDELEQTAPAKNRG